MTHDPTIVEEPSILHIHLRNGGALVLDQVISCSYRALATGGLAYLSMLQAPDAQHRLVVGALDLSCVVAIVMVNKPSAPAAVAAEGSH